ncbi:MAG: hypothetical protein IH594_10160, partial [Bacteroidales bacterium]|nr:hypothetical protein [Bacteroidales bacterium]
PKIEIQIKDDGTFLSFMADERVLQMKNKMVTSELLGKTVISDLGFINQDNSGITIDKDFLGNPRNENNPTAGPFEFTNVGMQSIKIWK